MDIMLLSNNSKNCGTKNRASSVNSRSHQETKIRNNLLEDLIDNVDLKERTSSLASMIKQNSMWEWIWKYAKVNEATLYFNLGLKGKNSIVEDEMSKQTTAETSQFRNTESGEWSNWKANKGKWYFILSQFSTWRVTILE